MIIMTMICLVICDPFHHIIFLHKIFTSFFC